MDWKELAATALAALGGVTGAFLLLFRFCGKRFADYLSSGIQFRFDSRLEEKKTQNEKRLYVSTHRFDREYEILYKIVEDVYDFTFLTYGVLESLQRNDFDQQYSAFKDACGAFTKYYYKHRAFIDQGISDVLETLVKELDQFRVLASHCRNTHIKYKNADMLDSDGYMTHFIQNRRIMGEIHDEINTGTEYGVPKITDMVRQYLSCLEIK